MRRLPIPTLALATLALAPAAALAGGPRLIAGVTFFNQGLAGQPARWASGKIQYFVDQGPLSATVTNAQAVALVDKAAAPWGQVATAAVALTDAGPLAEDVSGANLVVQSGQIAAPADVTPSATAEPIAVLFDQDGSILDAIFGQYTSDPVDCQQNAVVAWVDNVGADATLAHGVLVINGRCANSAARVTMIGWLVERAFGQLLGLDNAQINPTAQADGSSAELAGWPLMQPKAGLCGNFGGACLPGTNALRYDDQAALGRLYPVTAANLAQFTGKKLTAANTVSITGTVSFAAGSGMQGVNVVARPLDAHGNAMPQYAVSSVSGFLYAGNRGNPVTGTADANGRPFSDWGAEDASLQGYFDLSAMPLPPGVTAASYQVSFEPIDAGDVGAASVGPYVLGSPLPSGVLAPVQVAALAAGGAKSLTIKATGAAQGGVNAAVGSALQPMPLPVSGFWAGRLTTVGAADWFEFPVRAGRSFTVMTLAQDEKGQPTARKAMPALAVFDTLLTGNASPIAAGVALNGWSLGQSLITVTTRADDTLRLVVADQRGDGRPDYNYQGMVLYVDTVEPLRLPASGGAMILHGTGFRMTDTVKIGGRAATVTGISPTEIDLIAPASKGVTGSVDVEVDDAAVAHAAAVVSGGVSYDAGSGDALTLDSAPMNTVPVGVPEVFQVTALAPDLTAAAGDTVLFQVVSGAATLGCGKASCAVQAAGDGTAQMTVTANDQNLSIVTASLNNGSSIQTEFTGGPSAVLTALTPRISVAAGATVNWTAQAIVLNSGAPVGGQAVAWQSSTAGLTPNGSTSAITDSTGVAQKILTVGPLSKGSLVSTQACLNGTSQCASFSALGARPEYATVGAVSGTAQTLAASQTPQQIVLRLYDMNGNPMAGGTVTLYESLYAWTPPCGMHGRCAQAQLLKTAATTAVSAIDGTVIIAPISLPGVATRLSAVAATGNASTLNITIEMHP